jgi:hypothetical protein
MLCTKTVILLFFTVISFFGVNAQSSHFEWHTADKSYGLKYQNPLSLTPPKINNSPFYIPALFPHQPNNISVRAFAQHYQQQLGFFCKMEHKLEYNTKFPVKFRLGEVNYVDVLEGKRNANFYP